MPPTIRRSDKAEFGGSRSTAEDIRVVGRINPDQTARDHRPFSISTVAFIILPASRRRSDAENTEGGDDCKRAERLISTHGKPPVVLT
jgi:hypothetical protein